MQAKSTGEFTLYACPFVTSLVKVRNKAKKQPGIRVLPLPLDILLGRRRLKKGVFGQTLFSPTSWSCGIQLGNFGIAQC